MDNCVATLTSLEALKLLPKNQAVEIRLDLIPEWRDTEVLNLWLRANEERKIILTFRPLDGVDRFEMLQDVYWNGIDYLDVELDGDSDYIHQMRELLSDKDVRLIYSSHNYSSYDSHLPFYSDYLKYKREGDLYKYAGQGEKNVASNYKAWMSSLGELEDMHSGICIVMGSEGQFSRIKGVELGMPWTYVSCDSKLEAAPGQLTLDEWKNIEGELGRVKKLNAVVGQPILHSKSPNIFNTVFLKNNKNEKYIRWAIDNPEELKKWGEELSLGFINITAPYKKEVAGAFGYGDDGSAFNYYKFNSSVLKNTDVLALIDILNEHKEGKSKLVLFGGGGAAEAVLSANKGRLPVQLYARSPERVRIDLDYVDVRSLYDQIELNNCIVVYTIPSSVLPSLNVQFGENVVWVDANYKDSTKDLLNNRAQYVSGTTWLQKQAEPIINEYGQNLNEEEWSSVLNTVNGYSRIALVGLPGAGKTSIGTELAHRLGWDHIDMDDFIEEEAGKSIPYIFQNEGEAVFRNLEVDALRKIQNESQVVVSCGGGVIESGMARVLLENNFLVFFLLVEPEESARRINGSDRPLLMNRNATEVANELFQSRKHRYLKISDLILDVTNRSIDEAADKLYEEYSQTF